MSKMKNCKNCNMEKKINKIRKILSNDKKFEKYKKKHPNTTVELILDEELLDDAEYQLIVKESIGSMASSMYNLGYMTSGLIDNSVLRIIFIPVGDR